MAKGINEENLARGILSRIRGNMIQWGIRRATLISPK